MAFLKRRTTEPIVRRDPLRAYYQSARWHRFSLNYLKQNRLCKLCLDSGRTTIAKVVDHITPAITWMQQGNNFYDFRALHSS